MASGRRSRSRPGRTEWIDAEIYEQLAGLRQPTSVGRGAQVSRLFRGQIGAPLAGRLS
jgi:hypothetical protein